MGSTSGVFRVAKIGSRFALHRANSLDKQKTDSGRFGSLVKPGLLAKPLLLAASALIWGCSGGGTWSGSSSPQRQSSTSILKQDAAAGTEIARRSLLDSSANADYQLEIVEREATSEIEILMTHSGLDKPIVTSLDSPPRIVLDLQGALGPKASSIDTPESLYVSKVRIGAHPDKSRIVLDMNEGQNVVPTLNQTAAGTYVLKIAKADSVTSTDVASSGVASESRASANRASSDLDAVEESRTAKSINFDDKGNPDVAYAPVESPIAAVDSKKMKESLASDKTIEEDFSLPKEEFDSKMASPKLDSEILAPSSVEDTKTATGRPQADSALPTVFSFQLQSLSKSENTLIIDGQALTHYSLKRTAPSEYVLRFPGATLAMGAQETLIAPQGSGAIRSVRSTGAGDVLELRIFTAPEETLEVKGGKENLVVAAATGFDFSEARAQAKPEVVEADAEALDNEISALLGEQPKYAGRLISLDLQDTDIDNALRIIAEVSNLNIIASDEVAGKITLRLIDVPWDQALDVILKTNGLDKVQEGNVIRIAPVERLRNERDSLKQARQAEEELEALGVRYVRISYAKASELQPLVESVLSERGSVAYDERTNQLIIKDIRKGIVNVAELIAKLDLRTPQVLLETQIVETTRNFSRELGSELGFSFVQSPETGNATGSNFPNSIAIGGSGTNGNASSFPVDESSAITFLLESADGTRSLASRLTAAEAEGRVKVVSRPAVATTNNKQATIKSVEKIRVRQPSGGLSVATGQGASANGTGSSATEIIEVGIVLEVTPQASPDYYVLLDINAKSSTLGSADRGADGIPTEIERSATSSILVSSGQTFAMGGIYKTTDDDQVRGVPYFKDIPVIGHLFRSMIVRNSDEELLFFITPRIIEGSFDDAAMKASL